MSTDMKTQLNGWFTGPSDELVPLAGFLTLRVGRVLFTLDLIVLMLLAYIAWTLSADDGNAMLALISGTVWVLAVLTVIWEFARSFYFADVPSLVHSEISDGKVLVTRFYARLLSTGMVALTVFILYSLVS